MATFGAAVLVSFLLAGCAGDGGPTGGGATEESSVEEPPAAAGPRSAARLSVRVIAEYPHDASAFTQGLLVHDGAVYESTGRRGQSRLRRVDPESGEASLERALPDHLFGEGLALVTGDDPRLIQITYQSGVALVWDVETFEPRGEFSYRGEGWGLTFDGERLIMSDGGSALVFRDPESFEETGRVDVTLEGAPVARLNELEWLDGFVWANVWGATSVAKIDPESGEIVAVADLSSLLGRLSAEEAAGIDVLNGIAWWPERESFLVTGKLWPRMFEVVFE